MLQAFLKGIASKQEYNLAYSADTTFCSIGLGY